jgi:hypothetical protein
MSETLQHRIYMAQMSFHTPGYAPYAWNLDCTVTPVQGATRDQVQALVIQEAATWAGIEPDKVIVDDFRLA